jgi:putative sigma-54 modulation protein
MVEKTKAKIREKFEHEEYPIQVIGRNVAITEPMKAYAVEKLIKVERFGGRVLDATITMDIQKLMHMVDFIIDVNNTKIKVVGRSENMYASVDQAIAHLEAKLRRYMRRLHEHHAKGLATTDMNVNIVSRISAIDDVNDQIEEETLQKVESALRPHPVVSRETRPLKTLTLQEAIMQMELSEDLFMIYRSEEDHKLKVIYRRSDENYGIIELEK